jgi:hypothetical protein
MLMEILKSTARIIKHFSFYHNFPYKGTLTNVETIILGNGPSLLTSLDSIDFNNKDIFAVNNFASSSVYKKIRPQYYVIADNYFWTHDPNSTVLKDIRDKTDWNMSFFVPAGVYKKAFFQNYLKNNQYIKVIPYNKTYIEGFGKFQKFYLTKNWGAPIIANVLVASIYLAINNGANNIKVYGADHSWTESIRVNEFNQVCIADTHFNSNTTYSPWEKSDGTLFTMAEILEAFSRMFRGYEIIRKYADYLNVHISNMTPGSYIDSFERGL